ncbi:Y-family DNA polymerase [Catenovulum sediminis]|uniref:DNA polymerase Y family protein n=1 Tax=Catenovulum sediminis TaxID=1740262 RepID=A0ABV1RIF3_9ALTE|nr:DNA polymerase Y family protein [Catenovulum sediminis]
MVLWLYVHFPALQLDSLFCDGHYPVAIVNRQKGELLQVNKEARQQGIRIGMGLGSAAALCADLQVFPYDQKLEKQRLQRIAQWLYLFTADIALDPPNGLFIRVSHMLSLYTSVTHFWQTLQDALQRVQVGYQYAFAYSPSAAKLLAGHAINQLTDDASVIQKQIALCDLSKTPLSVKLQDKLKRIGIHKVGDLLQLALPDIAKRFDIELVTFVGQLNGQLKQVLEFYHPPEQFKHHLELLFEVSNVSVLDKPLYKIYVLLQRFLNLRGKLAQTLLIELHLRDEASQFVKVTAGQGEASADKWLALSKLTLESVRLNAPVVALTLEAQSLINHAFERNDLFAGQQNSMSPQELIAQLQAKLGDKQVTQLQLVDDHRPELCSRLCPPDFSVTPKGYEHKLVPALRPSFLLAQAQPLHEKVEILHGPERINTGWWDQHVVIRDYFIARTEQGRWLWIYRTPQQNWYVHGLFS